MNKIPYGFLRGMPVFGIDGNFVKTFYDQEFSDGGNGYRYSKFIPKNEIWLESTLIPVDTAATAVHERVEIERMRSGEPYEVAHTHANIHERVFRDAASRGLLGFNESCDHRGAIGLANVWMRQLGELTSFVRLCTSVK